MVFFTQMASKELLGCIVIIIRLICLIFKNSLMFLKRVISFLILYIHILEIKAKNLIIFNNSYSFIISYQFLAFVLGFTWITFSDRFLSLLWLQSWAQSLWTLEQSWCIINNKDPYYMFSMGLLWQSHFISLEFGGITSSFLDFLSILEFIMESSFGLQYILSQPKLELYISHI